MSDGHLGHRVAQRIEALHNHLTNSSPKLIGCTVEMTAKPTTRRIITGHDPAGYAVFDSDEVLTAVNPIRPGTTGPENSNEFGFTVIHKTSGNPVEVQGKVTEYHGKSIPLSDASGTVCRVVDFPPLGEESNAFMHRTQSLDFAIVLKGTIKLILDKGVEKTMSEGDIAVQR